MNKANAIIITILLFLLLGIIIFIEQENNNTPNKVELFFLPLKEADSSIITYKDKVIIIDTGEDKDQDILYRKLEKRKIQKIDYLILTHPDKDHIGNAKFLIDNYNIGIILQTDYNKKSKLQEELNKTIEEKNVKNEIVKEKKEIQLEDLKIEIRPPEEKYEDSNNNSLITIITFKDTKALFAGDIREERMQEILQKTEEIDLLKYPYHGRKNELSKEFIQKTKPKMTIITGEEPDDEIIKQLEAVKSKIRLTSEQEVEVTFK